MSSASLSIATRPSSSSPASLYTNKLSSPPCFSFSLPSPNPKKLPITLLKSQTQFSISSFSLLNPSNSRPVLLFSAAAAASFDGFEPEIEHNPTSELEEGEESEGAVEYGIQQEEEEKDRIVTRSSESGRLYVGNLPYSMTSAQLAEIFEEAGLVVNVEIVYDRVTDRSRGFGFVTMGSVEEAQEAIRMFDGSQVGGRTVKVNFPEVPRGGERELAGPRIRNSNRGFVDSPHKLYAGNLGWDLTSQGLRDAFADQAGVLSAKVIYDRNSGRSKGFGFVSFGSAEAVESALNSMNGVEVEGRPLRLNMAAGRATSPSFGGNTENNPETSELLSSVSS